MPSLTETAQRIAEAYTPPATGRHCDIADAEAVSQFLHSIAEGNYLETACSVSGLGRATVYRWLKTAETEDDPNHPVVRFREAYEKARAMSEAEDVANVRRAGRQPQYWAASMTYLERRYPDRWGKRPETDAGPRVIVQIGLSAEHVPMVANQVNVMGTYQTQNESESLSLQAVTAPYRGASEAKAVGESAIEERAAIAGDGATETESAQRRENPRP